MIASGNNISIIKNNLEIIQKNSEIVFIFSLDGSFEPIKLVAYNKDLQIEYKITKNNNKFYSAVNYDSLFSNFIGKINFKIIGIINGKTKKILLGNFSSYKYDYFKTVCSKTKCLYPYFTLDNNFALLIYDDEESFKINYQLYIKNIYFDHNSMNLLANIYMYSNKIKRLYLILKPRTRKDNILINLKKTYTRDQKSYFEYILNEKIFLSNLYLKEDTYDVYIGIQIFGSDKIFEKRVSINSYRIRSKVKTIYIKHDIITIIDPYYTFKGNALSFMVEQIDKELYNQIKNIKYNKSHQEVWLLGEQPFKAQDTAYHLFKHIRLNMPEKKAYYVIKFDSPEYNNIKKLGNVIEYKSKEHFELLSRVTHLIASHHIYYLLPLKNKDYQKKIKAKKVFLQHGVFGMKNISNIYAKTVSSFDVDMFLVSSKKEKKYCTDDLHYLDDQVKITGLSRFDSLFKNDIKLKRQILIIPTWRDWLLNYDAFVKSEYYHRFYSLLSSSRIREMSKRYNFEIVFCLHPNMQKYVNLFNLDGIRVISQGEINVQDLIKESTLMVTDYSSVAFDFSFLKKPVIYYQFDLKRFLGKLPSHLDVNNDLPGDIVKNEDDLLLKIEEYANNNFIMKDEFYKRAMQYLEYKDTNNCKRIIEEIEKFEVKNNYIDKFLKSEFMQYIYIKFRKSKYYFPLMRIAYNLFKLLPLKDRVVFESALGTQYSDAPKYIFEELIRKYPNIEYIWIKNQKIYNVPDNVKRVERLSWKYYYYLATSKYWVNNQNFPHYIKKRKKTVFLQTWHGTPLKKMLYDIKEIHGRDPGYIKRVEKAKNQWSYLLSQSPYATRCFRSAFRYNGKILELGYSRNDILVNNKDNIKYIEKIKNVIGIPRNKKVILYAPTFRDNAKKRGSKFSMEIAINFEKFITSVSEDYILLLRLHFLTRVDSKILDKYKDRVIDVSDYEDIQELYLISNILITDYSSVFFDYAILRRPIIFYAYDLEEYRDKIRGFYLDYNKDLPGVIVKNEQKLYETISNIDKYYTNIKEKHEKFIETYLPKDDGKATKRIVDYIFKFKTKKDK